VSARSGALRRRRKPSFATRLRICWVFIVLGAGAAGYAAYLLVTLPALRVHVVEVRIDGPIVSERQVLRAANIDRARNVWLLDTAQIARRIEAIPYVDAVTVRRVPPAQLTITVTERELAACVRSGTRVVSIDGNRRILQDGCGEPDAIRVVLRNAALGPPGSFAASAALAVLLADARVLRDANIGLRALSQDRFGQLVAVDDKGIQLLFGADVDVAEKAKLVAPVLAAASPGRVIRAIDLRAPATPTVQFR
jgi:cell division septal protein FtsQ